MTTAASTDTARAIARRILAGADDVLDCTVQLNQGYDPPVARPDHLRAIAEFWADVARRKPTKLVVSSAPRFGKSVLNCVGAAWAMYCRPGLRIVLVSATQDLADELSRNIRSYAERIGLVVPRDQRSVSRWAATNGSEMRTYGIDASLVGVAADVLCADDLLPSMAAANSATEREKVDEFFRGQAIARMQPGASAIVCMHRWSADDQIQTLIDRGWPDANIPACDFTTGESMFPALWSTEQLREKERDVGPLLWQAQYQGCPAPRGGSVFTGPPTTYNQLELRAKLAAHTARITIACDPAGTATRTSADHSVIMVGAFHGYGSDLTLDIIDVWRGQVEVPDLVDRLVEIQRRWGAIVGVEGNGVGKAVPQYLRRVNPHLRVVELRSATDKLTRALPAAAAWSRGAIRWPASAHWLPGVLREIAAFHGQGGQADDSADCLVHLWTTGIGITHAENTKRRANKIISSFPFG